MLTDATSCSCWTQTVDATFTYSASTGVRLACDSCRRRCRWRYSGLIIGCFSESPCFTDWWLCVDGVSDWAPLPLIRLHYWCPAPFALINQSNIIPSWATLSICWLLSRQRSVFLFRLLFLKACFLSSCLQFNDLVVLFLLQRWEALRWLQFSEGSRRWTSPLAPNSTQILQKNNKSSVTGKRVQILDQVVATFRDEGWRAGERRVFWKLCSVCV